MAFEPQLQEKRRKVCPLKLCVPELPQDCIGSKCMWFMNMQDECAVKMLARLAGNLYPIGKAK